MILRISSISSTRSYDPAHNMMMSNNSNRSSADIVPARFTLNTNNPMNNNQYDSYDYDMNRLNLRDESSNSLVPYKSPAVRNSSSCLADNSTAYFGDNRRPFFVLNCTTSAEPMNFSKENNKSIPSVFYEAYQAITAARCGANAWELGRCVCDLHA